MSENKTTAYGLADWLGYLTRKEVDLLKQLASSLCKQSPVFVNIGAGAGTSGLALAEACPGADLYTVDIRPGGPLGGLESERNAFAGTGLVLPTQILGDSKLVGLEWRIPIDLLFVDGDHSDTGVAGDIDAWLPHVRAGGIVAFHDYGSEKWPHVKAVVDVKMVNATVIANAGRVIAFSKS
jgi:predicted O-methyltransferase YrrM